MAKSLLDVAKDHDENRKFGRKPDRVTDQQMEVAIAWLVGDISGGAAAKALGISISGYASKIAQILKAAYDAGLLKVKF